MILNKEEVQDLVFGGYVFVNNTNDTNNDIKYEVIEEGEWLQGHKYQYCTIIFHDVETDKFYKLRVSRFGNPFTDCCYDWEYIDKYECPEVVKTEVTITQWKKI